MAVRDKLPEKVWLFVIILPEARLYLKPQTELTNLLSIHTRGGEEGPPGGGGGGGMFEVNVSAGGLPEVVECSRARGLPEVGWKCTEFESTEDHQRLLPTQEEK